MLKAIGLLIVTGLLFALTAVACSSDQAATNTPEIPTKTSTSLPEVVDPERAARAREAIESAYPEFGNFEKQESFAGTSVKSEVHDGDYFFAYMTLGSGVPVAEATCFRVDRIGRAFKVGMFPDPLDSYAGYRDVDPRDCRGIK